MLEQQKVTMDVILSKLHLLSKDSSQGEHNKLSAGSSGSRDKDNETNRSKEKNNGLH